MGKKQQKILVIDDDPTILDLVTTILTPVGYQVETVQSGEQALAFVDYSDEPIDLLLTDVVMPGMGGEEVALYFKKEYPSAPVLFMSAYLQPCVEKFKNTLGVPRKARADVINSDIAQPKPDQKVDFVDISCIVESFRGTPCELPGPPADGPCVP